MQQTFIMNCPLFPGFYHTALFDPDVEFFAREAMVRGLADNYVIPRDLLAEVARKHELFEIDYTGFEKEVAEDFVFYVADELEGALEHGCTMRLLEIDSPKFYNYRNDCAIVEATLDPDDVIAYCKKHDLCYEPSVDSWNGNKVSEMLEAILKDCRGESAEQDFCRMALEDHLFDDYIALSDLELDNALESEEVYELGKEYEQQLKYCGLYVEAMHNTPRSREIADNARKKIKEVYPGRLAALLGFPVEKKEVESDMVTVDLFAGN